MRIELPGRLVDGSITLRPLRAEDAVSYIDAFRADPDLGRLLGIEEDPDVEEVHQRAEQAPQRAEQGRAVEMAIAGSDTDAFLGSVILDSFEWQHRRCEVGFWIVPAARGRGVALRGVSLIVSWAFSALKLLRIEMTTTPDNIAAAALAERLGFVREGVLRQRNIERRQRVDVVWFGLLREEWKRS